MLDLNNIEKRYFDVKVKNIRLQLEPPSKKMLKQVVGLTDKKGGDETDELYEAAKMILNKNRTNYKVKQEMVDELDFDEISTLLTEYFNWIAKTKSSPN